MEIEEEVYIESESEEENDDDMIFTLLQLRIKGKPGAAFKMDPSDSRYPKNLLIRDQKPVLFIGEGNFTFTFAFAALRQKLNELPPEEVWEGITSTRYEVSKRIPSVIEVKLGCISAVALYCEKQVRGLSPESAMPFVEEMKDKERRLLALPPADSWRCGVDATKLDQSLVSPYSAGVIWFQCPWTEDRKNVGDLVEKFLLSAGKSLNEGGVVCLGLMNSVHYMHDYKLKEILGGHPDGGTAVLEQFAFLGADKDLVREVLEFGYRHQGKKNIHASNIKNHITLVFAKK